MSSPSTIFGGNLALWLKANAGCYSDAGTTLCTDGTQVYQWNDQSGNGNNATQTTAANRPYYYSTLGGPVVSTEIGFTATDGGDAYMTLPAGLSLNRQTCSVFFYGELCVNNLQHISLSVWRIRCGVKTTRAVSSSSIARHVYGFDKELVPDMRKSMLGWVTASGNVWIYWRDRLARSPADQPRTPRRAERCSDLQRAIA